MTPVINIHKVDGHTKCRLTQQKLMLFLLLVKMKVVFLIDLYFCGFCF